jgi:LmbE family N-acetylglucosaminyl deacetylase
MIRSHYDFIYLSPHLDDAALSCGGQIFAYTAAGRTVLIVTLMAGDPLTPPLTDFVRSLHARWELLTDATAGRRAEDIRACQILGADHLHWEIPDCVYRIHPKTGAPMYADSESIFGEVHQAEAALPERLAQHIATLPAHEQCLVPMSVGHHVDHQITRKAAELGLESDRIAYYEEYPYVGEDLALDAVIGGNGEQWSAEVIPVGPADLQAKIGSIAAYASQLSTFFADRDDLQKQVSDYVHLVGGERIWHRPPRATRTTR